MAAQTAGLRIQRRRVEHIRELMAGIADREHITVQLLVLLCRSTYYFFTGAFLIAGFVTLVAGQQDRAALWGGLGLGLLAMWVLVRGAGRILHRAFDELRKEITTSLPGKSAKAKPGP